MIPWPWLIPIVLAGILVGYLWAMLDYWSVHE